MLFPDLFAAIREHKWLIVLGTLACVIATAVVTSLQQKYYESSAVVRIEPVGDDSSANQRYEASQRLVRTYVEIYQRGAVDQRIRDLLRDSRPIGPDELVASQVKDLDLLSVGASSTDPRRAERLANAGWRALEEFSPRDRLIPVTRAELPTEPSSPNVALNLALALFGGLILSTGLALVLYAVRQPIPGPDQLERDFGQPVLATIPHLRFKSTDDRRRARQARHADAMGGISASESLGGSAGMGREGARTQEPSLVGDEPSRGGRGQVSG